MIPYSKQDITQQDIDAVINVLKSDFLTQGPKVPLFEKTISDYCNVNHAVAVNSATSALHIACLALELGEGDYLWTSPNTFVASANCALYCGAKVDFVDIDPQTYNMSADELEKKLVKAKLEGKLPKVVIPVHFAGQSCDMQKIHKLSKQYDFKIIEDASHAIGSKYLQQPVGGCKYADITVFSFHPVKIITTAEGGLATTNQPYLAMKMGLYRSHGVTRDARLITNKVEGAWHYQQIELGYNYRMTEMQAALGISQMERLDSFIKMRHDLFKNYQSKLKNLPITLPYQSPSSYSSLHLYPILLELSKIKKNKSQVFDELRSKGIGVNVHYIPVHTQPFYQQQGYKQGDFPNAENYYAKSISIPLFYQMTSLQQSEVINVLKSVLI